ncbi:hypothetical protein HHI36_013953 [Cryptolaemus montrouzieri]|uniref:PiggyBac transposable element-derived protein domain-containing protein n=1 Tax=Cryptolaemus montrouzieri TaxID=559131 RepID=A0ABD2N1B5_9CUCU
MYVDDKTVAFSEDNDTLLNEEIENTIPHLDNWFKDIVLSVINSASVPPNQGYKFFFDNYFSSIQLFQHLTSTGYCATGTIRDNRVGKCSLTEKSVMQKQETGTYDFRTESALSDGRITR